MENRGGGGGAAVPTGCYKCGRPGHWSRDCPSNPNPNPSATDDTSPSFKAGAASGASKPPFQKPTEKPKKVPKKRPKLTAESLLSDDGLGFVLRHFPRAFKYRGRGHEVSDLGNLLGLYAEWHSHLIPYYSFNQFVHKVEQVGASKRVKLCIKDLRDRVANGGDPTKLHESPPQEEDLNHEQADTAIDLEEPTPVQQDDIFQNQDITDNLQVELLNEIYQTSTTEKEASEVNLNDKSRESAPAAGAEKQVPSQTTIQNPSNSSSSSSSNSSNIQFSEEQKVRIEANRLKALERAAARLRSTTTTTTTTAPSHPT